MLILLPATTALSSSVSSSSSVLRTLPPHAGYHGRLARQRQRPFFEGWYLRLVLPEESDPTSFAFIFHVFDPHNIHSSRRGVGVQVLMSEEDTSKTKTVTLECPDLYRFRASSDQLDVRNLFRNGNSFQLTANKLRGRVSEEKNNNEATVVTFNVDLMPQIGWGGGLGGGANNAPRRRQYSTAGWLAAFPIFDPHYQILVSKGIARGSIIIYDDHDDDNGRRQQKKKEYNFSNATIYLEKNWGSSFPSAYWWIQANTFEQNSDTVCVTAAGGKRRLPLYKDEEEVGFVGLHINNDRNGEIQFLPFPDCHWDVQWGRWIIHGKYEEYSVRLTGTCSEDPSNAIPVRCPTIDGMKPLALETFHGTLRVELFKMDNQYERPQLVLDVTTHDACLETGGFNQRWKGSSAMDEPLKSVILNKQLDRIGHDMLSFANMFVDIPGL